MVRSFATSVGFLRPEQPAETAAAHQADEARPDRNALDKAVPLLVAAFLGIAIASIAHHFTTLRDVQLEAGRNNLALSARIVASEVNRERVATPDAVRIPAIPAVALAPARSFLVIDRDGTIAAAHMALSPVGKPVGTLFASNFDVRSLGQEPAPAALADGTTISALIQPLSDGDMQLLAFEPVDEELRVWRYAAHMLGAILLCFGAVTIAFSAAFYAQRKRTRKAGKQARSIRSQFEIALDHGHCGLLDWVPGQRDIRMSETMLRLLGLPEGASPSLPDLAARLHPDDCTLFEDIAAGALRGEEAFDTLFRIEHAGGQWMWLRMRAIMTRKNREGAGELLGIVMDVTEERVAEEAGRRTDARLRDAIESISEAFVLWDENNRLVMCNSKYRSFHGIPDAMTERGTPYKILMASASEPRVQIEIDRGSNPENGARSYEAQLQDGRWLLISERHTRDGGYVSVGTDITARKLQEERLIENERQLRITIADLGASREAFRQQAVQISELADRYLEQKAAAISANRAKAEFLANMNHEIRTPLNHIIGFAEIIETEIYGPVGSPRYTEYAGDIRKSGASLLGLISDILDMARVEAGRVSLDRTPTAIGQILEAAAADVRDSTRAKNIEIEVDPDLSQKAGQRIVHVDAGAISQALVHLLRNSVRLSPTNGKVSVRARMSGDHINIFVADTGCVLTAGELGTLVDAFGHIDGMLEDGCKGSGLGVPIARALIELHGGTLRLRSAPHFGSLVMIHLPVAHRPVQLDLPMGGLAA